MKCLGGVAYDKRKQNIAHEHNLSRIIFSMRQTPLDLLEQIIRRR
jgi:hypothetical protein